jgi:hypothetical protein
MFDAMIRELETHPTPDVTITVTEYNQWKRLYTFEGLKGQRYGQSFCNHFDIQDHRVFFDQDWQRCDEIIQRDWLIKLHT